jgi:hypothetical protein
MPLLCLVLCRIGSDGSPIESRLEVSVGVGSPGLSLDYISVGVLLV